MMHYYHTDLPPNAAPTMLPNPNVTCSSENALVLFSALWFSVNSAIMLLSTLIFPFYHACTCTYVSVIFCHCRSPCIYLQIILKKSLLLMPMRMISITQTEIRPRWSRQDQIAQQAYDRFGPKVIPTASLCIENDRVSVQVGDFQRVIIKAGYYLIRIVPWQRPM